MYGRIRKIHFIVIGGIGMSGIAEVLLNLGYQVSGSDLKESEVTRRLVALGGEVDYGHRAENLRSARVYDSLEEAVQRFRLLPPQACAHPWVADLIARRGLKQVEQGMAVLEALVIASGEVHAQARFELCNLAAHLEGIEQRIRHRIICLSRIAKDA